VFGCIEVRFTDTQADDVLALGLELRDASGESDSRRGLDALNAS
jgi:hypothetical protein